MKKTNKKLTDRYLNSGFLVVGNIGLSGCSSYQRNEKDSKYEGKRLEEDWETHKTVTNIDEQNAVRIQRDACWATVAKLGSHIGGFGFFVPSERAEELDAVLLQCESDVRAYNRKATCTGLTCEWATFAIAGDNTQIAKVIYDKLVGTLNEVGQAVKSGDVKALRGALARVGKESSMLPKETIGELDQIVIDLREQAKAAMKKTKKSNVTAADAIAAEVKKHVSAAPVNTARAAIVEIQKKVSKEVKKTGYVSSVNAKSIEIK